MENKKIKIGKVDLGHEYEDEKNQKLRITMWIDGDIYDELNKRAKSGEGKGRYQTLMNEILRQVLFEKKEALSETSTQALDRKFLKEFLEGRGWKVIHDSIDQRVRKEMSEIRKEVRSLMTSKNHSIRKKSTLKTK